MMESQYCGSSRSATPWAAGVLYGVGADGDGEQVDELEIFAVGRRLAARRDKSATWNRALLSSPDPDVGQLGTGVAADILAVLGDPASSLAVLREPTLVVLGGEVVGRHGRGVRGPDDPAGRRAGCALSAR